MKPSPTAGYSAVVTTGIYCRPDCSARPAPGNVRPFPLAIAAEVAGYRPCHRCRPYRTSEPNRWLEGPDLVCRAVQLIVAGALDGAGEDALAAKLGVSSRHLRRLFDVHVGATPDQVARSRRAHFARRLLDDTDLPVTDIAFAAGFGSVRQMNRTMLDVFRSRPTELRTRRRRADRLAADGGLELRLSYEPPLGYESMVGFFHPRGIPGVESTSVGTYRRTIEVDDAPAVIEIFPPPAKPPDATPSELRLRLHLPAWGGLLHLCERARRLFDLDSDPLAVDSHLARDRRLRPLVRANPGLRLPGAWDGFEVAVRALLGQQVSVAAATTISGRLVERCGRAVPGLAPFGLRYLFPSPADVARADLSALGLPGSRVAAVTNLAAAVVAGDVDLDGHRSLQELVESLLAVRGVGPWTAHYVALRLGERDAFPAGDLALRRGYARLTGVESVSARELEAAAEAWRPWRAYSAMHLWSAASAAPVGARNAHRG